MKRLCLIALVVGLMLFSASYANAQSPSAETLSKAIQSAVPAEFGYVENTDYLMKHEFSSLQNVLEGCIVVCADSTNFSEFGVFLVEKPEDVKSCIACLREYLDKRKEQFKSGVVYNAEEYPKFENAKAWAVGRFVVYTILDSTQNAIVEKTVKSMLK